MANPYDFTPELKIKILAEIHRRLPTIECPLCHRVNWEMADGFATVPLFRNVWRADRISGLPSAALVCTSCGNTLLINLIAIGFKDAVSPDMDELLRRMRGEGG
jgi:hypothetical protein